GGDIIEPAVLLNGGNHTYWNSDQQPQNERSAGNTQRCPNSRNQIFHYRNTAYGTGTPIKINTICLGPFEILDIQRISQTITGTDTLSYYRGHLGVGSQFAQRVTRCQEQN